MALTKLEERLVKAVNYLQAILNDKDMQHLPRLRRIVNDANMEWLIQQIRYPFREYYIHTDTAKEIKDTIKIIRSYK